ncbi:hypothetical protein E2C01_081848 [Portunus trituberculatus]|uniref:Uncharacterized protein n=1 Tax=Portunus trituberculatus TaxID=210409 RepID=A0A5B7IQU9_PORTR|nr:hypothetical protein [Portunus trituberculatus]
MISTLSIAKTLLRINFIISVGFRKIVAT